MREKKAKKLDLNVSGRSKIRKTSDDFKDITKLSYNTTLLDRMYKKVTFESLDVSSNFSIHEDTGFAKGGYMRVYNILKYPERIIYTESTAFMSGLLNSIKLSKSGGMNSALFRENVDFYFETYNRPYNIMFNKNIRDNYNNLLRLEQSLMKGIAGGNEARGSQTVNKELKNLSTDNLRFRLAEVRKKLRSHEIIRQNQAEGGTQIESYQFIRLVCKSKNMLETAENKLLSTLGGEDIQVRRVSNLTEYFETFSPVSGLYNMKENNNFAYTIFTTRGYSKLKNKPTRILENELKGMSRLLYVGTEISNSEPLTLTFTSSGKGQNILIIGTTGSGKTYLFENLMMNCALNGYKINAMDYKGKEYDNVAAIIPNTIKLDFSLESKQFVNTLKFIPELYDEGELKGAFIRNTEATIQSLIALAELREDLVRSAEGMMEECIRSIYNSEQVFFDRPETYFKSQNINYVEAIGNMVVRFQNDNNLKSVYGEEVCKALYTSLIPYFSLGSHKSEMFTEELDLREVVTSDCILYSYNMNQETPWGGLASYRVFTHDYVSNTFIQRNKKLGFTTVNSIEEYQRAVKQPRSKEIYNNKLSGGRSDNVINVIMSNTIAPLLDRSLDASAVRENIATLFIGDIIDKDSLDDFCRVYGIGESGKRDINNLRYYSHAFYTNYNTGVQRGEKVIKVVHPSSVIRYFETKRIDREGEF